MPVESDTELRALLEAVHTIAVVGIKAGPSDDAFRVPQYMQRQGYRILPVSPKLTRVLGAPAVDALARLDASPDLVNLFRAPAHVPAHADEILALRPRPRAVWMQLGIRHEAAAARLEAAGIAVVQDRCLMVEHGRLLGAGRAPARVVRVHFDFASTLCYVAHRQMERMAADLERLGIELAWTPLDLSRLTGWPRGAEVPRARRANAVRVARELGVAVDVPRVWPDSRRAGASALVVEERAGATGAAAWRERVFSAVFEERRDVANAGSLAALGRELGLEIDAPAIEAALGALEDRTRAAHEEMVTGVPTFMLGRWPFGGIQSRETMRHVLARWSRRAGAE